MDTDFGTALGAMSDAELERMRREAQQRKPQQPQQHEPAVGVVLEQLTKREIAALKNDARNLQKIRAENAKRENEEARRRAKELQRQQQQDDF